LAAIIPQSAVASRRNAPPQAKMTFASQVQSAAAANPNGLLDDSNEMVLNGKCFNRFA